MKAKKYGDDNAWSLSKEVQEFMARFYEHAFPNMTRHQAVTSVNWQRKGIDRIVYLDDGTTVRIDEKIRRRCYDHPDFLIEYEHTDGVPGWINKDLNIDYIAYVWVSEQCGYLLPWQDMKNAWAQYGDRWKELYPIPPSPNGRYSTLNVAVPDHVLLGVVKGTFIEVNGSNV